jgi:hypothetical protein
MVISYQLRLCLALLSLYMVAGEGQLAAGSPYGAGVGRLCALRCSVAHCAAMLLPYARLRPCLL